MSTYVDASPKENVRRRHCRARFWLPNCFTALARVYIDARQIDCVQWLELETMRALGEEWDTLCALWEAAKGMNFVRMPCIWHCGWKMAWKEMLRTHGGDVASGWSGVDADSRGPRAPSQRQRWCRRLASCLESLRRDSHQVGRRNQMIQT